MKPLLEARHLVQYYGAVKALDLPEFCLRENEAVTLTGPNGCGKSTLLRILAFLEKPAAGQLHYYGDKRHPRQEITLLLQEPYLFRDTVFRNVTLGLVLRGQRHDLREKFQTAMRMAGFAEPDKFGQRRQGALSGGEKQRVALAARLILRPRILLLDEPTAFVDAKSADIIIAALNGIIHAGAAIVCATHDAGLVRALQARNISLAH